MAINPLFDATVRHTLTLYQLPSTDEGFANVQIVAVLFTAAVSAWAVANIQAAAGAVELPAGDVVQSFEIVANVIKVPMAATKDALIRPGGNGFGKEKVVILLIVRLWDEAANEVGGTVFDEWRGVAVQPEGFDAAVRQLVRVITAARAAEGDDLFGLHRKRHLYAEVAAFFDEAAGVGGAVNNGGDFCRSEVEQADPRCAHGVLAAIVGGRKDDRRAVVEQAVGFVEGNGLEAHGLSFQSGGCLREIGFHAALQGTGAPAAQADQMPRDIAVASSSEWNKTGANLQGVHKLVTHAIIPSTTPGALAITIGQSRSFLKRPYTNHSVQLIAAQSGWIGLPLFPARLF